MSFSDENKTAVANTSECTNQYSYLHEYGRSDSECYVIRQYEYKYIAII